MDAKTIKDMGEREIIREFISPIIRPFDDAYKLDDCAVVPADAVGTLLISTDQGPKKTFLEVLDIGGPEDIGHFHVTMNVSDIAAMGGTPVGFVMGLVLSPETTVEFLRRYLDGVAQASLEYDIPLLGGDTKEGDSLRNTITVLGKTGRKQPLGRHRALAGDSIYTTGIIGRILSNYIDVMRSTQEGSWKPIIRSTAKISEGKQLLSTEICKCCIDVSDGLLYALHEIGRSSNVVCALDVSSVLIDVPKSGMIDSKEWRDFVFNIGCDSDLVFTLPPGHDDVADSIGAHKIGTVMACQQLKPGINLSMLECAGITFQPWEHFRTSQGITNMLRRFL